MSSRRFGGISSDIPLPRLDESRLPEEMSPMTLLELRDAFPSRAVPVVDGLLRRGETMNVIAAPKVGKTWLAHGLARSIALGDDWLGFPTTKGRVLICDAELHPAELCQRLEVVLGPNAHNSFVNALPLRGKGYDLNRLAQQLCLIVPEYYSLIVIDALYRFIPSGTSENDNAAMMALYNRLDYVANCTKAAVAVIHHSSKGDQSTKGITDIGAGAGAIARAADTHVAIRPHEEKDMAVLQAVTRSFVQPADRSIRWVYPHWIWESTLPRIASRQTAASEAQKRKDKEADELIRKALNGRKMSISEIRSKTGMGQQRVERALERVGATGRKAKNTRTGKVAERFSLPSSS